MRPFWIIFVLQCLVVLALVFGDIGFDHPGRFGLSFDHFLILLLIQGCLAIVAVGSVSRTRRWKSVGIQFLVLVLTAAGVIVGDLWNS